MVDVLNNFTASNEEKTNAEIVLGSQISLIHVYFKQLEVVQILKQENYGVMDLIGKNVI